VEPFIIIPERYGLLTMAIGEVSDRTKTYRKLETLAFKKNKGHGLFKNQFQQI